MEILSSKYTEQEHILNSDIQLRRLERNQKHIAQLYGKLRSYVCEPKTYGQYQQLDSLREDARKLRDTNGKITEILKKESNAAVRGARLLQVHLKNFKIFSDKVDSYLVAVKSHRTAHI